jgi:hypothetical protein
LKTLLEQQLNTFDTFFNDFNKSSFSQLDRFFSNDLTWQIRPFSLYPEVFTKSGLDYGRGEIGGLFREIKEKLLKDVEVGRTKF